jgi:proliferating cell nuclear antigen
MFEALIQDGQLLKKIVESIKDLVADVNIDITEKGFSMQAMDSSHVALVTLNLNRPCFQAFRVERATTIGLSITNLHKVLKLVTAGDSLTMRIDEDMAYMSIIF